jgi:transposase
LVAKHLAQERHDVRGAFRAAGLLSMPVAPRCTRGKREPRIIGLQAREHFEALQGARRHQKTTTFRASYAARAGIEGTHAQAVSRCGLRRCRYIGLAKTRLQHVLTAVAVNLVRVAEWCAGTPIAKTRRSRFAALQTA